MFKSIKDSLGLLNPSWLFSQLGKLSLNQWDFCWPFLPKSESSLSPQRGCLHLDWHCYRFEIPCNYRAVGGSTVSNQGNSSFFVMLPVSCFFSGKKYYWFQMTLDEDVPESVTPQLLYLSLSFFVCTSTGHFVLAQSRGRVYMDRFLLNSLTSVQCE